MSLKDNLPDGTLASLWNMADWSFCEEELAAMQRKISLAAIRRDAPAIVEYQKQLVRSQSAKMLAVKHVADNVTQPGIDGEKWATAAKRMKAVYALTSKGYESSPMRMVVVNPKKGTTGKTRHIQVPTVYDRAMHVLYAYSLDPVSEARADRKSFAFRKGRSLHDIHAYLVSALQNGAEYIIKADVKAHYESISHDWLLNNIPMDTFVLKQFLKAGHFFGGELFPPLEHGISLGSSISPILGNMVLDGLQHYIYERLYGRTENIDYADGNMLRFADDIIVTVKSYENAELVMKIISEFVAVRGLRLNEEKSFIVPANVGFDFLGRHYVAVDGVVDTAPSEASVNRMERKVHETIEGFRGGQKELIDKLNKMLTGWASYHKITDARDEYRHLDVVIKTLLLELCQSLHPKTPLKTVINRYYYKDPDVENVYALPDKPSVRVMRLADTVMIDYHPVRTSFNPYLDREYAEKRSDERDISNVVGKYKSVWLRQEGICHLCGQHILADQRKSVVALDVNRALRADNAAYVHARCTGLEIEYLSSDEFYATATPVTEILETLKDPPRPTPRDKFQKLGEFFYNETRSSITLTFKEINAIIGSELCNSAYKAPNYWYVRGQGRLSESWRGNGYKLHKLKLEEQKVTFHRADTSLVVEIPEQILSGRVPPNAKAEIENFLDHPQPAESGVNRTGQAHRLPCFFVA